MVVVTSVPTSAKTYLSCVRWSEDLFPDYLSADLYSLNKLRRQARHSGVETEPARKTADYGQLFEKVAIENNSLSIFTFFKIYILT